MLVLILEKKNVYWYSKVLCENSTYFAAIAMTINPRYTYRDENGMEQQLALLKDQKYLLEVISKQLLIICVKLE